MNKYIHERYENTLGYRYHERQLGEPKISLMEMLAHIEKSLDALGESIDSLSITFFPVIRSSIAMADADQAPKSSHHSGAVTTAININEKIGNLQQRIIHIIEGVEL
jgi:hypothetical protein